MNIIIIHKSENLMTKNNILVNGDIGSPGSRSNLKKILGSYKSTGNEILF